MNATSTTATIASPSTANNWGFKTPIQFKVALNLAQEFHHLWGNQIPETKKIPLPNGATKLVEEWRDPISPAEAASAAEKYTEDMKKRWGYCLAQYGTPTPKWESGSRTYGVSVRPDGSYVMTYNGLLWCEYTPQGERIAAGLVPRWWEWSSDPKGHGSTLQQSMRYACARGIGGGCQEPDLIRLFEADKNFWRSGLVAGSRWYEWWDGAGPDMTE